MGGTICCKKVINIAITIQEITPIDNPTTSIEEPTQYYVEMHHSPIAMSLELDKPSTIPFGLMKASPQGNLMSLQSTLQIVMNNYNTKSKLLLI
jgi:hypothetical protein